MSRIVDAPVAVTRAASPEDPYGVPVTFHWKRRRYVVENIIDRWLDTGCWWEGEHEKAFFRIRCQGGGIYDLYCDRETGEWRLYKILD